MDWVLIAGMLLFALLGYYKNVNKSLKKQKDVEAVERLTRPYEYLKNSTDSEEQARYYEVVDDAWRVVRGEMSRDKFTRLHGRGQFGAHPMLHTGGRIAAPPVTPVQQILQLDAVVRDGGVLEFAGQTLRLEHKDLRGVVEAIQLLPQGTTLHLELPERAWFVDGGNIHPPELAIAVEVIKGIAESKRIRIT